MKNKNLVARKAALRIVSVITRQITGVHCPASGLWQDQFGDSRFVAEGDIFPSTANGPVEWHLQDADVFAPLDRTRQYSEVTR